MYMKYEKYKYKKFGETCTECVQLYRWLYIEAGAVITWHPTPLQANFIWNGEVTNFVFFFIWYIKFCRSMNFCIERKWLVVRVVGRSRRCTTVMASGGGRPLPLVDFLTRVGDSISPVSLRLNLSKQFRP